ncbi:MAG: hypothetical protein ABJB47_08475 [Actinomycetota bacterium]
MALTCGAAGITGGPPEHSRPSGPTPLSRQAHATQADWLGLGGASRDSGPVPPGE